jgi:hypothetical protein
MQLYDNDGTYKEECKIFEQIISQYPQLHFFQPSPEKAPWHVQVIMDSDAGREGELNFWPHKLKVSYRGPSKSGVAAIHEAINEAINDVIQSSRGDFDLIERFE